MDSLRYWVHRDARRRLPLRPRVGAGARVLRRRPPLGVLRRHPPGPGALPGEADRRAVGRRARRLPGGQLPGALGASGTASTATTMRDFWRGESDGVAEFASRLTGSSDLYQTDGRRAVRLDQLHHRARRLHAAPTSSPTTTSTTRRTSRTTATAPTTTARWNCGVEGPTDDPAINELRAAPAAQLPGHAAALPGRADAARRRRDGPHPGRQQQRLLPGQRDLAGSTGTSTTTRDACSTSRSRLIAPAPRAPGLPPARLLRRRATATARGCPTSGGSAPTAAR